MLICIHLIHRHPEAHTQHRHVPIIAKLLSIVPLCTLHKLSWFCGLTTTTTTKEHAQEVWPLDEAINSKSWGKKKEQNSNMIIFWNNKHFRELCGSQRLNKHIATEGHTQEITQVLVSFSHPLSPRGSKGHQRVRGEKKKGHTHTHLLLATKAC